MAAKRLTNLVRAGIPPLMDAVFDKIAEIEADDCQQMFPPNDPTGDSGDCVCDRCLALDRLEEATEWLRQHFLAMRIDYSKDEQLVTKTVSEEAKSNPFLTPSQLAGYHCPKSPDGVHTFVFDTMEVTGYSQLCETYPGSDGDAHFTTYQDQNGNTLILRPEPIQRL